MFLKKIFSAICVLCLLATSTLALAEESVLPSEDFCAYANRALFAETPEQEGVTVRYTDAYNAFVDNQLKQMYSQLLDPTSTFDEASAAFRISGVFRQMQAVRAGADENSFVLHLLEQVQACSTLGELMTLSDDLFNQYGLPLLLSVSSYQSPDKTVYPCLRSLLMSSYAYLWGGDVNDELRACRVDKLAEMMTAIGMDAAVAKETAQMAEDLEFAFAKQATGTLSGDEDYLLVSLSQAQSLMSPFDLSAILTRVGIPAEKQETVAVTNANVYDAFSEIFTQENLTVLKAVMLSEIAQICTPYLTPAQYQLSRQLTMIERGHLTEEAVLATLDTSSEQALRESRVDAGIDAPSPFTSQEEMIAALPNFMMNEVNTVITHTLCSDELLARITDITEELRGAFRQTMENCTWLSDSSRESALAKVDSMYMILGAPSYYGHGTIKDTYIETVLSYQYARERWWVDCIMHPEYLRDQILFPTYVDNAKYDAANNSVNLMAAMLAWTSYDSSEAVLYGIVAETIAHEMSHGFDPHGVLFDANGVNAPWMSEADNAQYANRVEKAIGHYTQTEYRPGKTQAASYATDDVLTSESIADLCAVTTVMNMLADRPELQRAALETWAQRMGGVVQTEAMDDANNARNDHPIYRVRVNGLVPLLDAFYTLYDIPVDSPMYVAPENRVEIW